MPSTARHARVARTVAAACGALAELSVDDLADVRLLVDEVFHALTAIGTGPITMRLAPRRHQLWIEVSCRRADGPGWAAPGLNLLAGLAEVMAIEPTFEDDGESVVFCTTMRAGLSRPPGDR